MDKETKVTLKTFAFVACVFGILASMFIFPLWGALVGFSLTLLFIAANFGIPAWRDRFNRTAKDD